MSPLQMLKGGGEHKVRLGLQISIILASGNNMTDTYDRRSIISRTQRIHSIDDYSTAVGPLPS
jgi:hypothetical protein